MSGILRGTTPDFVIKVKQEDFLVTDVTKLEVTIWNGSRQSIYGLEDVEVDTTVNAFGIHFTEADTLALDSSKTFRWQMRAMFADGNIVGTRQSAPISIEPLKSREVMSI
jgi:hypothetical protein